MKRPEAIIAPQSAREDGSARLQLLNRLKTIAFPRTLEDERMEPVSEQVIAIGVTLSVVGVVLQTALHLTDILVFDRGVNIFDADEDYTVSAWASIVTTFTAAMGALLAGLVTRRWFFFWLAALFAFFSLDDFVRAHERIGELGTVVGIEKDLELGRVIWPLLFLPVLAAGAALLWLAAREFSGRAAWLTHAGVLVLACAVVLEAASAGLFQLGYDHKSWLYEIEVILEEGAELVGWIWIATALIAVVCSTLADSGRRL
jgi:hypothetical protein